jgi:tRNA 2-thiouridine synthesizing protein A
MVESSTERTIERELVPMKWDAGNMGCGQLVFELSRRVKAMKPGERLEITTQDPGASTDLPAWCRMTGNTLVSAHHPVYVIERRKD